MLSRITTSSSYYYLLLVPRFLSLPPPTTSQASRARRPRRAMVARDDHAEGVHGAIPVVSSAVAKRATEVVLAPTVVRQGRRSRLQDSKSRQLNGKGQRSPEELRAGSSALARVSPPQSTARRSRAALRQA